MSIPQDNGRGPSFNIHAPGNNPRLRQVPVSRSSRQTPCDGRLRVARNESYPPHSPQNSAFSAGNSLTRQMRRALPGSVLHTCHNPVLQTIELASSASTLP
jgi:hypothetical protein